MPVVIFNKRTGKYLKKHSGSYRDLMWKAGFYGKLYNEIREKLGPAPHRNKDEEAWNKYRQEVRQLAEEKAFSAAPEDARVYATEASAMSSVGKRTTWIAPECRTDNKKKVYELPDHLEAHEIKESFVCVMRPDGSSNCDEDEEQE